MLNLFQHLLIFRRLVKPAMTGALIMGFLEVPFKNFKNTKLSFFFHIALDVQVFTVSATLSTARSSACTQRPSGFA